MTRTRRKPSCPAEAAALAAIIALMATEAHADPCTAKVSGHKAGDKVSGTIRYVGDGDSLCIGSSTDPATWVEIRLADFYAPELSTAPGRDAKRALDRLKGQPVTCTAQRGNRGRTTSFDRLVAVCRVRGVSIAEYMKRAGVSQGGRGW